MSEISNRPLATGTEIKFRGGKYTISDKSIADGDYIYNWPTKKIDYCLKTFQDSDLCVEFMDRDSGCLRAMILDKKWYQKLVKI